MIGFKILIAVVIILLLQLCWKRRNLYRASWNLPGVISFPVIGGLYLFLNERDIVRKMSQLARKNGAPMAFWLGQRFAIYFTNPSDAEIIINHPNSMDKGDVYKYIERSIGGPGLFSAGGDYWKSHRRLLNPTIQNTKIINSFYPTMNGCLKVLVDRLGMKHSDEVFNIYEFIAACTFDMIGENTFGVDLNVQKNQNLHIFKWVNEGTIIIRKKIFEPVFQFEPFFRCTKYYKMWERNTSGLRSFIKDVLRKRVVELSSTENTQKTGDAYTKRLRIFVDEIIQLSREQKCFSEEEMINESLTILLAGYETAAVTISNIIVMLAMHPEYQEMVYQEILAISHNNNAPVAGEHLNQLSFTDRFIKESMRYLPTLPLTSRLAKADFYVGKVYVPAGTEIMISHYDMQRNKKIWGDDAELFNPDHFLAERLEHQHPYAFIPFSKGARNCMGQKYAQIVVQMFVVWLVRNFKFTTNLKLEQLTFEWLVVMKLSDGYPVKIEKREEK